MDNDAPPGPVIDVNFQLLALLVTLLPFSVTVTYLTISDTLYDVVEIGL